MMCGRVYHFAEIVCCAYVCYETHNIRELGTILHGNVYCVTNLYSMVHESGHDSVLVVCQTSDAGSLHSAGYTGGHSRAENR